MTGMTFTPGIGWHDPVSRNHHKSVIVTGDTPLSIRTLSVPMPRNVGTNPAFVVQPPR